MRNTKIIDPSLKKKINENDEKMKTLYGMEFQRSKSRKQTARSTTRNNQRNKKKKNNDSYTDMNIKTYNEEPRTDSKIAKKLNTDRNESAFVSRMQKRMQFKKDKEEKKNNTIFFNTFSNVYRKMEDKKKKKTLKKGQVNKMVDRLYRNDYKHKKHPYKEPEEKKIDLEEEPDVDEMIERFEDDMRKREENLEIIKRQIEKDERKKCTYKPEMSEGSRRFNDANEADFFERQKNFYEKRAKKEEKLKETLKKKKEDEINENNILKQKEEQKKKDAENNKANVEKTIKNLFDWDEQRKKKLEEKQKEKTDKIETNYKYVPKINQRSAQLAESNQQRQKQPNIFLRLAEEDKVLKEKKQILTDMYTPSFKPTPYMPRNMNLENLKRSNYISQYDNELDEEEENAKKHKKRRKKHKKKEESNEENEDEDDEDEDEEDEDEEGEEEEDDEEEEEERDEPKEFDYKQDPMIFAEDEVQEALRNEIFHKNKK